MPGENGENVNILQINRFLKTTAKVERRFYPTSTQTVLVGWAVFKTKKSRWNAELYENCDDFD